MRVEEEFENVMLNIEIQVTDTTNKYPDLSDAGVDRVYNALLSKYKTLSKGKDAKESAFRSEAEQELYEKIELISDLLTGINKESELAAALEDQGAVSFENMVAIFKRLRKSVKMWTKRGGSTGYIYYIAQFMPGLSENNPRGKKPAIDKLIDIGLENSKYLDEK